MLASVVEGLRTDYPEAFAGVRLPITALRGEDSAIVSLAAWAAARELLPDIDWVDVADADHDVPEDSPLSLPAPSTGCYARSRSSRSTGKGNQPCRSTLQTLAV